METKSKTKTKTKTKTGEAPREHKKPWQETYATVEEIKQMVSNRVMLRYNEVRRRTEVHWLSEGPVIQENEQGLLTIFGEEGAVSDGYRNLGDRDINTLWGELCEEKPVIKQHLQNIIESDFVPSYHPFRHYLEHLPDWKQEDGDNILLLAMSVNVRGDSDEQLLFYQYLKKWLVAMVASWINPTVVNNVMLVLIGEQGSYKTTWFSHLLPPQLREYFYTKTNSGMVSKDDLLVLSQYGLVCWEELDSMLPKELNKLKAAMTMPSINERGAYERYHENRPHVASFCGTGNNVQFLSDTTGTRRWLPFEVDSIESPLSTPFDYDGIYAQAYALYKNGFRYWFDRAEIEQLQQHNKAFETSQSANELVDEHFRKPVGIEGGDFLPASVILQLVGGVNMRELSAATLGRALTAMGFESKLVHGLRRYRVVRRTEAEKELHRHLQEMGGEGGEVE
jgi:predicted P-loop ATPase